MGQEFSTGVGTGLPFIAHPEPWIFPRGQLSGGHLIRFSFACQGLFGGSG